MQRRLPLRKAKTLRTPTSKLELQVRLGITKEIFSNGVAVFYISLFLTDPTCEEVGKCTEPAFVSMTDGSITTESVNLPFVPTVGQLF